MNLKIINVNNNVNVNKITATQSTGHKTSPRRPKTAPRRPQDRPKKVPRPSKTPQDPKTPPERTQDAPKSPQESENEANMEPSWHEKLAQINAYVMSTYHK